VENGWQGTGITASRRHRPFGYNGETQNVGFFPAISDQMLKRGFQFAPGYRLQEFLGRGQFGQVWRATAPGGAACAVKFIDLSDGQGQKEYEGIKRVKQIRHANLMPITAIWLLDGEGKVIEEAPDEATETLDLSVAEARGQSAVLRNKGVDPSWLAVSMLLGGASLQKRLQECIAEGLPGIPPKELIAYMDESAKGLDFLNSPQHDLGEGPIAIQHCDVKPANIVLIGSSAVVCDFGLARILTRNQATATSAAGTPAYMAPEAISGKQARTSDQYSLAVTYYHLRTGTLPVNDGSLWEVLDAHRQGKLKLGLVPQAEQEVLRKATDLNWENRFDTNLDMVDALRDALRAEGSSRPSFVTSASASAGLAATEAAIPVGATKPAAGDPTQTIDVKPAVNPAHSLTETQPFKQAETHPESGFLRETLPALDQSRPERPTESVVTTLQRNPKVLVGIGVGLIGLVLLGMMFSGGSDPQPDTGNGNGSLTTTPPKTTPDVEPTIDSQQLLQEAIALFTTDEKTAISKYSQALDADPGLAFVTSAKLKRSHKGPVMTMVQSGDGSQLVSLGDDAAPFLWSLAAQSLDAWQPIELTGHKSGITSVAFSPNNERLLTAGYSDAIARVWDLKSDQPGASSLELDMVSGEVNSTAWHPTDPIAITASNNDEIGIWKIGRRDEQNPAGVKQESSMIPVDYAIDSLAMDVAGRWLAVLPKSLESDTDVRLYDWQEVINTFSQSASPKPIMLGAKAARKMAFLRGTDVSRLVIGDTGGQVSIYKLSETPVIDDGGRIKVAHSGSVEALRIVHASDREFIVTGAADGSVHWWNRSSTGDERIKRQFGDDTQPISCVDVSQDGRWVVAGTGSGSVWLWDTSAGESSGAIELASGANSVDSVVIDAAGRWLIAGCEDGAIRVWELTNVKLLAKTRPSDGQLKIEKETTIDASLSMR
jgi:serine/threonine protein kinase